MEKKASISHRHGPLLTDFHTNVHSGQLATVDEPREHWDWMASNFTAQLNVVSLDHLGRFQFIGEFGCPSRKSAFCEIRGSLWNYWHLPSRTKTKDSFINLRFNSFKVFIVGVQSFFRLFATKIGRKEKTHPFERNLNVALPLSSTSLRVKTVIPCVLSLNFENRGEEQVDRGLS